MKIITRDVPPRAAWTLEQSGVHPLLARLFAARGIASPDELDDALGRLLPPESLKGAREAAVALADAVLGNQRLCIVADYDCDGATACATALRGLRLLGATQVDHVVPDRVVDGYGLTASIARRVKERGADVLITVDNGIASVDGVRAARSLGMSVIVTDHHLPAQQDGQTVLPQDCIIVNPNQPGCDFESKSMAGVGVMFYVLLALRAELRRRGVFDAASQPRIDSLLPLVALGTVADVVKLDANNRRLVSQGLRRVRAGAMPAGMAALFTVAARQPATATSFDFGFALGPRLNAAGRLADMTLGIECLCTDDAGRADELARMLDGINRERKVIEGDMREQALMTLALAPLTLLLFGQVSVVGLLANLVAIPWVSWVVTPLTLLGGLLPALWDLAALALDPLHRLLVFLADSDRAVWSRAAWPWPWALAALAGAVLAVMPWPPLLRCSGLLVLAWALTWTPDRPALGHFRLLALDVGQGSAVLVQTRHHALLHDTGPAWGAAGDAGARVVVPTLKALGVAPDRVVVSHRDTDHAGGARAVRLAWPEATWLSSEASLAPTPCHSGQQWRVDGVHFEVLSPLAEDYTPDGRGRLPSNAMSCVLRVEAADGTSAVLTGDVDAARETRLALARPDLRTDLLMSPHHGSRSSSSPVLLNVWRPSVVIVQAGFMNRFGHPAADVLERYRARQISVFDSPSCGAAGWHSAAPWQVTCERQHRMRYWHARVEPAANPPTGSLRP